MAFKCTPGDCAISGETGIVYKKGLSIQIPSSFAKEHLFCVLWSDEYVCVPPYRVRRKNLASFLFFYILEGELCFSYREQAFTAAAGDIVLLDCRFPHEYWAELRVRFYFFHFNGNIAEAYCEDIYSRNGCIFRHTADTALYFTAIQDEMAAESIDEHRLSKLVYNLLAALATVHKEDLSPEMARAKQYILANLSRSIRTADIAAHVSFSRSHFSRQFQKEVGVPPHEYLMEARIHASCELLCTSADSVERIAEHCGFSSTSNFIRSFKKMMNISPARFRQYYVAEQI